ncbi:MAG: hypothetical protein ACH349_01490 [Candidatus Rhabdochlamydia sp.]
MSGYVPGTSNEKVFQFTQFFFDAYRTWGVYYAAAYRDLRAYAGDNWTNLEKTKLERQNRMILELNKIRRVINLYSGYERENRTSTVCAPVEGSDVETADQFSDVLYYVYEKANADYIISEAFEHSLKTGLSIIGIYMDYSRDKVNGDIKMYWKPFNALMLDPYFTKRDLSDCDQASTRDLLSKEQIKSMLPWIDPMFIDNLPTGIRDNKYQYLGIYRQYNSTYIAKNLCTYDQYWKRINRVQKYLVDMETGVTEEWDGDKDEERALKTQLKEDAARRRELGLSPRLELISSHKRSVELNIIVSGQLLYSGPDPTGLDDYPFVPVLMYHEPLIDTFELKIQGLVRSIRDAQRQYNRRHSQIIDLMESIINTGYITKNGAVLDPNMLMQAGQGKQIVVNEGYDVNADIREISPPNIPPGYLQYQDIIDKNIMEIPGASDELLGLSSVGDSQVSGKLAEVRASNGLKGNRGIFDNLEQSRKYLGKLVIECIQKNYSPGKIARIIGQEPTEQFLSGQFEEYDCAIKQAVKTSTQREAYYYQLLQLVALGAPIPWADILEVAPLQGSTKLHEVMRQQAEQAQQAAQIEQEAAQMQKALDMAAVNQSNALAEERRARVLADIGLAKERESEVTQNHAKAFLDNAKTIAQIEDIPRKRLTEVLKLAANIRQNEMQQAEVELQKDMKRAEALK